MNKVIVFLFLSNNVTNNIFCNKLCSQSKKGCYVGKNAKEIEKDKFLSGDNGEDEEKKQKEEQKQKEIEEQKQKELEEQRQKEFNEQKQLENSKQDFINRFNKINTEIVNLINHKNNKFKIKKEEKLKVTLEEINELKFGEIGNFDDKIKKSENNFNGLITDLVKNLKTKFDDLKKKETNTIKLDIEENNFINLKESSKIIEIDNKLTNFEKAITDGKDGILQEIEPVYKELFLKLDKISKFDKIKNAFDFNANTLDLIKTKEIAELLEIKTKLDNLKSKYEEIINKKSSDSKTKYSNLNAIITNYKTIFTDSTFEISEINEENFKFENYEENYEEIDQNITNIETKLNNEFNDKLVVLNNEENEIKEKLESFNVSGDLSDYKFKEDKDLNNKLIFLRNAKQSIDSLKKFLDEKRKDKKDDCTNKLDNIKKDKNGNNISDDILDVFNDKFNKISNNINSLECNGDYNDIIKAIEDLQEKISEKIEEKRKEEEKRREEDKKKKDIEDFIKNYKNKTITNYNDFEKAFSSVKNIYDNINEENKDINEILNNLIEVQGLEINKNFNRVGKKLQKIGKGGYGVVYKYTEGKKEFALKRITTMDINGNIIDINSIKKEIKYLLLFKGYNNILQIKDAYISNNNKYFYLSTEYYEKGALTQNFGKLTDEDIINIMYELIIALRNIHKNGVIHCDIKHDNIFLDKNNKAYIGDFGIAKFGNYCTINSGTQYFLMRNVLYKEYYGRRCDLYALLISFVSLIEGKDISHPDVEGYDLYIYDNKKEIFLEKYQEYKNLKKITGFYDIFEEVFLKKNNEILDWDKFLQTNFWKNLESEYKKQNNIK